MYDRQILADYFKGKRGKDAEVQRQFGLLRRQAEIDCRDLRELGDKRVTPESIEEDYIYNAQLNAKTQQTSSYGPDGSGAIDHLKGSKSPTAKDLLRVVFLSMIGPIILSAVGPIYYGYTHGPYWRVIVWAVAVTVLFLWWARSSFKNALSTAQTSVNAALNIVAIVLVVANRFAYWRLAALFPCGCTALSAGPSDCRSRA
jgi:hypothetical protein